MFAEGAIAGILTPSCLKCFDTAVLKNKQRKSSEDSQMIISLYPPSHTYCTYHTSISNSINRHCYYICGLLPMHSSWCIEVPESTNFRRLIKSGECSLRDFQIIDRGAGSAAASNAEHLHKSYFPISPLPNGRSLHLSFCMLISTILLLIQQKNIFVLSHTPF